VHFQNLNSLKGITVEVALKFFSGDIGGTMESGEHINRYFRDACGVGKRKIELAKLQKERDALRNRQLLLDRDNVDPDLAGELMRKELNVVAPDEVVVPLK
jgi:cell division protein FtsB